MLNAKNAVAIVPPSKCQLLRWDVAVLRRRLAASQRVVAVLADFPEAVSGTRRSSGMCL